MYLSPILGIFREGGHGKLNAFSLVFAKLYTLLVLSKGKTFRKKYMKYDLCLSVKMLLEMRVQSITL